MLLFIRAAACPKCAFMIPHKAVAIWRLSETKERYRCPSCETLFAEEDLEIRKVGLLKMGTLRANLKKGRGLTQSRNKTNRDKALGKIAINNSLMGISLAIFSALWVFSQKPPELAVLIQFLFAVPLFYVSSNSYMKVAYREQKTNLWDHFGWVTGTTATAFVLNIIGILCFFLGHMTLAIIYFGFFWLVLFTYTILNIITDHQRTPTHISKFLYFVLIQLLFGLGFIIHAPWLP